MHMTKKLLAILLVIGMMCAAFVGCKSPDTPNTPGDSEQGTQDAPGNATVYGIYSTDQPVKTLEEVFADEIKHTEDTYASGSSYSEEKINDIYKIADYIANYQKYVEEYDVQDQLDELYEQTGFTLDLGFGANMIKHYLGMSSETYDYSDRMEELLAHPKVSAAQSTCISAAMKAAENLVKDGQSGVSVNQSQPMSFTSLKSQDGTIYFALGTYHAMADLSNVKRTGDAFSATVTFRILDCYSWDENGKQPEFTSYLNKLDDKYRTLLAEMVDMPTLEGFCQADLAQLHYAGLAQNFLAHGTVQYNVTWVAGQSFDQATVTPAQ